MGYSNSFFLDKMRWLLYTLDNNGDDDMKKGFTLIELLAVIVVLAILALVAIPIVSDVIDEGKKGAMENSVIFYVQEIETKFSEWMIEGIPDEVIYTTNSSGQMFLNVINLNRVLKLEGKKPISGTVEIDNNYEDVNSQFGYVVNASLEYEGGYIVQYTYIDNKANIEINKK